MFTVKIMTKKQTVLHAADFVMVMRYTDDNYKETRDEWDKNLRNRYAEEGKTSVEVEAAVEQYRLGYPHAIVEYKKDGQIYSHELHGWELAYIINEQGTTVETIKPDERYGMNYEPNEDRS